MFTQGVRLEDGRPAPHSGFSRSACCWGAAPGLRAAMCRHFSNLWASTERLRPALKFPYRQQSEFPRFEKFMKREPPRSHHAKCKCGSGDAWRCWSRVRALELYGGSRRDDGVEMLVDLELLDDEGDQ